MTALRFGQPVGGDTKGLHITMGKLTRAFAATIAAATGTLGTWLLAPPSHAYGGDGAGVGSLDVYQIEVSFNCNNSSICGDLGGFWGWFELDHNPTTGVNTGDGEGAGCAHGGGFSGAQHESAEILNWWTGDGSAGPNTVFTDETDTTTFRGQRDVETFYGEDTGIALVPGHQSATTVFGQRPPPGVNFEVQIAYKPAQ